ncbi:uncharacterized protein [Physcomitrium patens]|uniref:uncharacterized protein isoform X1 n=1 Tax=Physcomitrium patens TaxID=3218 RepID=UPI000D16FA67|nr:uncharacterized protein LOC112279778 isoform X1 [Physcomitrium patens]|eukprot:XP_024370216.1 uncharacterized protein LOC112279778 isoform X1 [Physcomitrella patens]
MRRSILRRQMRQRSPFTRTISSIHYPAMQQKEGAVSAPNSLSSASLTLRLTKFLGFPDIWSFSSEDLRGRSSPGRSRGGDRGGSYGGGGGSYGIEELATEGCDDHQSTLGKDGSLGGAIATLNVSCFGVEFTSKKPPV